MIPKTKYKIQCMGLVYEPYIRMSRKIQAGKRRNTNTAIIKRIMVNIRKCLASRELFVVTLVVVAVVLDREHVAAAVAILPPIVFAKLLGIVELEEWPDRQLQFLGCSVNDLDCCVVFGVWGFFSSILFAD